MRGRFHHRPDYCRHQHNDIKARFRSDSRWIAASLIAVCAALTSCSTATQNQDSRNGSDSAVTITLEPFVETREVSAVYAKVRNDGPHLVLFMGPFPTFFAIDANGSNVNTLSPEAAVVAAGGESQLAMGLKHMPSSNAAVELEQIKLILPWTADSHQVMCDPASSSYSWIMCHGGAWVFLPFDAFVAAPTLALGAALSQALPEDANYHRRIESGAFRFGNGLLGVGSSATGYLFFPPGKYQGVSVVVKDAVTNNLITVSSLPR